MFILSLHSYESNAGINVNILLEYMKNKIMTYNFQLYINTFSNKGWLGLIKYFNETILIILQTKIISYIHKIICSNKKCCGQEGGSEPVCPVVFQCPSAD